VAMPGCAPPEMRPAPRAAQQRRGGVASTAARLLRNGGRRPRGVPHWRGALAPTGLTVARGRRPTGDTPSSEPVSAGPGVCPTGKAPCATTGAPALQGRRRTGDAPSATTEVPGPRGVAPPATHPPPGTVHQHQGLSGYVFWAVIGYGYTPILRIRLRITPSVEIRIRISASGTGYFRRLYSYPDTIIRFDYNPPSPTDSSIRAQEERHPAVIRVLNGRQCDLKSTLDFIAPTGLVQAVPRRLCKRTSE